MGIGDSIKMVTLDDLKAYDSSKFDATGESDGRAPTNAIDFLTAAIAMFTTAFVPENEEKPNEDGYDWLIKSYCKYCWDAKETKFEVYPIGSKMRKSLVKAAGISESLIPSWVDAGLPMGLKGNSLFCIIVRGKEGQEVHSEIRRGGADNREACLIMTFKLYQAVISVMCSAFYVTRLKECKLGSKALKAGNLQTNVEYWLGIHGHSGLYFVANMVRALEKSNSKDTVSKKLPSLSLLCAFAVRLDESNGRMEKDVSPTLVSIIRTCGFNSENASQLRENVKARLENWSNYFPSKGGNSVHHDFAATFTTPKKPST